MEVPSTFTVGVVGISWCVCFVIKKQAGHSSDSAVHSVLSGVCHISLNAVLIHGQSSVRHPSPTMMKKWLSLGFMDNLQQTRTPPQGGHKTLKKTQCEEKHMHLSFIALCTDNDVWFSIMFKWKVKRTQGWEFNVLTHCGKCPHF